MSGFPPAPRAPLPDASSVNRCSGYKYATKQGVFRNTSLRQRVADGALRSDAHRSQDLPSFPNRPIRRKCNLFPRTLYMGNNGRKFAAIFFLHVLLIGDSLHEMSS